MVARGARGSRPETTVVSDMRSIVPAAFLVAMTVANAQAAQPDGLFAGVWAQSCDQGETFTFHNRDRLKIVDLDCKVLGWIRRGEHYSSLLHCTLDGVDSRSRIDVVRLGDRLRISMGGLTTTVRPCP